MRAVEYYEAYNNAEYKLFKHKLQQLYRNERVMDFLEIASGTKISVGSNNKPPNNEPKIVLRNEKVNQNSIRKIDNEQPEVKNKNTTNEAQFSINPSELKIIQDTPIRTNKNKKVESPNPNVKKFEAPNQILKKPEQKRDIVSDLRVPITHSDANIAWKRDSKRQLELDVHHATKNIDIASKQEIMIDKLELRQEKNALMIKSSLLNQVDDIQRRIMERKQKLNVTRLMNRTQALSDRSCIEFNSSFMGIDNARNILDDYKKEFETKKYPNILSDSPADKNSTDPNPFDLNSGNREGLSQNVQGFTPILNSQESPRKPPAPVVSDGNSQVKSTLEKARRPPLPTKKQPVLKNVITESIVIDRAITDIPAINYLGIEANSPIKLVNFNPDTKAAYFEDNIKFATPEKGFTPDLTRKSSANYSVSKVDDNNNEPNLNRQDSTNFKAKLDETMPSFLDEHMDVQNTPNNNFPVDNDISGIMPNISENDPRLTKKDNEQIQMDLGSKVMNITEDDKEYSEYGSSNVDEKNSNTHKNNTEVENKNSNNNLNALAVPKDNSSPRSSEVITTSDLLDKQNALKKSRSFEDLQEKVSPKPAIIDSPDGSLEDDKKATNKNIASKNFSRKITLKDDDTNQIVEKVYVTPKQEELSLVEQMKKDIQKETELLKSIPIVKGFEPIEESELQTPETKKQALDNLNTLQTPENDTNIAFKSLVLNNTPTPGNDKKITINIVNVDQDELPGTPRLEEVEQSNQNEITLENNIGFANTSQEVNNEIDSSNVQRKSARDIFNEKQKEKKTKDVKVTSQVNIFPVKSIATRDKNKSSAKKNYLNVNDEGFVTSNSPRSFNEDNKKNDLEESEVKNQIISKRIPKRNKP